MQATGDGLVVSTADRSTYFSVSADGAHVVQVLAAPDIDGVISSRDGAFLAARERLDRTHFRYDLMNADGTGRTVIPVPSGWDVAAAYVGQDGTLYLEARHGPNITRDPSELLAARLGDHRFSVARRPARMGSDTDSSDSSGIGECGSLGKRTVLGLLDEKARRMAFVTAPRGFLSPESCGIAANGRTIAAITRGPNHGLYLIADRDGTLRVVRIRANVGFEEPPDVDLGLMSSDGRRVYLTGESPQPAREVDLATGHVLRMPNRADAESPDGRYIVSSVQQFNAVAVRVLDRARSFRRRAIYRAFSPPAFVEWASDSRHLIVGLGAAGDGRVYAYDVTTGHRVLLDHEGGLVLWGAGVPLFAGGRALFLATDRSTIYVADANGFGASPLTAPTG